MNPSELSSVLRKIAASINNSSNPSRELVVKDLQKILASLKMAAPPSVPRLVEQEDMGASWERLNVPGMPQENVYDDPAQLGLLGDPTITHDPRDPAPGDESVELDLVPMDYVSSNGANDRPELGEYVIHCFEDPKNRNYDACVMIMNVPGTDNLVFNMKKSVTGMVPQFNLETLRPKSINSLENAYKALLRPDTIKDKGYLLNSQGDSIVDLLLQS